MRTDRWLSSLLICSACMLGLGCDAAEDAKPSGPNGQTDAGVTEIENPDPINEECPLNDVGPNEGPYAMKGACCYRTSNKARIDKQAAQRTLEYRLPYFLLINHLMTIDPALFATITIDRFENEEQNVLLRFELPQKDGELVEGPGKVKIGPGRYNCDGTYSFYGEQAAPSDSGQADRWFVPEIDLEVTDPEATDQALVSAPFKQSLSVRNRASFLPYLGAAPNYDLDWEGQSQGFNFLDLPIGEDNYDCIGSRDGSNWKPGGKSVAFARVDLNEAGTIDLLSISFCQLMAFGARADAPSCQAPRCMPGESGCPWVRLPDSLCPVTDDDKAKWGCHLGYGDNPDNAPLELNCSAEAPDDVDPDNGTTEGQCCDPLGREGSGLPACNAWAQINEFVAAAVEITDKPANELQQSCHGK